ncbi:hypothetical protein LH22_09685 [Pantoea rwandensis]|uniref:Uncharacterized protein n=1 Tax=Pantoea rwandensis TaxID=1076550 RepID=A0ABM5RI90_9GAMM|nr:hypothetical protein LH22_09685 [Pantoea rwandensis]
MKKLLNSNTVAPFFEIWRGVCKVILCLKIYAWDSIHNKINKVIINIQLISLAIVIIMLNMVSSKLMFAKLVKAGLNRHNEELLTSV